MCGGRFQYLSCLEHIARALGVTVANEELSIDEATQQIIDRAKQLYDNSYYDNSCHDQQTIIRTLQHKLKSLKERLHHKVRALRTDFISR